MAPHPLGRAFQRRAGPRQDRFVAQPALQIFRQRFRRRITARRILLETLEADCFDVSVNGRIASRWSLGFRFEDLPDCGSGRSACERRLACKQFVEHRAESIHINGRGESRILPSGLLRRDVRRRAQHCERVGDLRFAFNELRETKVREQRFIVRVEENVRRLDVAVQDAALMRVMHCARELRNEAGGAFAIKRRRDALGRWRRGGVLASRSSMPCQPIREAAALDQLHAKEVPSIVFADFVNRNDVGMVQAGDGFCFDAEAFEEIRRSKFPGEDELDGDHTIQRSLPRAIDNTHPTPRDRRQQLVIADAPRTIAHIFLDLRQQRAPHETARTEPLRRRGRKLTSAFRARGRGQRRHW